MDATNDETDIEIIAGSTEHNTRIRCCCGRPDCAYLEHNHAALGGLEKDLETAARLGQALLSRHESYISESQAEHTRLSTYISELEGERTSLQNANEKIVAENRDLLSQLEDLNSSLATSDGEVKRLEDLLLDCELEVKRLNGLVRKAEELDGRLLEMERERLALNTQIDEGRDDVRSTLARWRDSEKRVRELEQDLRRIEYEAKLDREKHEEIMMKVEKERGLERELGGAEGRLKGAAAMQSMKTNGPGSKTVVSHFVRDILQDNANLQAGIAELRELLQSSNNEVQNLREQIMLHQPVDEADGQDQRALQPTSSLDDEIAASQFPLKQVQQELHVHHHYHAKIAKKEKQSNLRRPSKRRTTKNTHGYSSESSCPSTPLSRPQRHCSSPVVPASTYHPQPTKNRWSMQSTATNSTVISSMPSSPRSYFDRGGSMFDRLEQGEESSRPTSPESVGDYTHPSWHQSATKAGNLGLGVFEEEEADDDLGNMSPLNEEKETDLEVQDVPTNTPLKMQPDQDLTPKPSIIMHPTVTGASSSITCTFDPRPPDKKVPPDPGEALTQGNSTLLNIPEIRPSLTRSKSHESLLSISGMDIHIAQRPSPTSTLKLLRGNSAHFAQSPSQAHKLSAAQPLASVTEFTAVSSFGSDGGPRSSPQLRRMPSGIEALSGFAVPAPRNSRNQIPPGGGLGRLVGGWVRGRWGIAPTKSVADMRSVSAGHSVITQSSKMVDQDDGSIRSGSESSSLAESNPVRIKPSTTTIGSVIPTSSIDESSSKPAALDNDLSFLFAGRSPGINQPGFIPGFRATIMNKRTPSDVQATVIDEEGLRESLAE